MKTKRTLAFILSLALTLTMLVSMPALAAGSYKVIATNGDHGLTIGSSNIFGNIQDAINAADAAGGGTVEIYPGDYDVPYTSGDSYICIPPNVTLQGVNASGNAVTTPLAKISSTYTTTTTAVPNFIHVTGANVTIAGLEIVSKDTAFILIEAYGDNFTLKDCDIHPKASPGEAGLIFIHYNSTIENNTIRSGMLSIRNRNVAANIIGNTFIGPYKTRDDSGYSINASIYFDETITSLATSGSVVIEDNDFTGVGDACLDMYRITNPAEVTATNNNFKPGKTLQDLGFAGTTDPSIAHPPTPPPTPPRIYEEDNRIYEEDTRWVRGSSTDGTTNSLTTITDPLIPLGSGPIIDNATWLDQAAAASAAAAARQLGVVRSKDGGVYGVRGNAWPELAGLRFEHDSVADGVVHVRAYINNPASLSADTLVSGWISGVEVDVVKAHFDKWFSNRLQVIHMDQQASWGTVLSFAARVNLSGMNTENLFFYSYKKTTNSFASIGQPDYWVDTNGYLHFSTPHAGDIIISDGPLTPKGQNLK